MSVFLVLDSRGSRVSNILRFLPGLRMKFSFKCPLKLPVMSIYISIDDGAVGASVSKQVEAVDGF